jgi:S1-C subfamily serine protease
MATVQITNPARKREGSGVVIASQAPFVYILTASHIVQRAEQLEIAVFSEQSLPKPKVVYNSAKVVAETGGLTDLAVLRLAGTEALTWVPVCPEASLPKGEILRVLTVGCDAGRPPSCYFEALSGKKLARREPNGDIASFWEIDRKYAKGRSGGPLLDSRGYVLGVCSGTNNDKTYFIHIEEIQRFLIRHGFRWLLHEDKNNLPKSPN